MEDAEKRFLEENDLERFVVFMVIILLLPLTYAEVGHSTILLYRNIPLTSRILGGSRIRLIRLLLVRHQFLLHL